MLTRRFFAVLALLVTLGWLCCRRQVVLVTSVLHPSTPFQAPLNTQVKFSIAVTRDDSVTTVVHTFPQYGEQSATGRHFRLENTRLLSEPGNKNEDSVLVMVVLKDAESWGEGRTAEDFFELLDSFDYPKEKLSVTVLTSSMSEFQVVQKQFRRQIQRYSRLSVLFRDDFGPHDVVTRENRHEHRVQINRRRVIARYRNFAVLATLELWHQHVVWLDADVHKVPSGLLKKMIQCRYYML